MSVSLPAKGRDLRLDIFRGIANWSIFINHFPGNIVALFTFRNIGFSDDADLFVFISGYTAAFVYARLMLDRGFVAGTAKLFRRAWQIYATYVFLLAFYLAAVGAGALNYNIPPLTGAWGADYNIAIFTVKPVETLWAALTLQYKPVNMDILPMYVVFMILFPLVLWSMLRKPNLTMLGSAAVYLAARQWGWNLPSYRVGTWYFNPFAWQLLFIFGSWCAMGGAQRFSGFVKSRMFTIGGSAYLLFALVMRTAERYPEFAALLPGGLVHAFVPNDKTNLAPYRFIHFVILAAFVARLIPRGFALFESRWFKPAALCGQKSLEVFALATMLAYMAHFYLEHFSNSMLSQILVSILGIGIMSLFAYMITQWKVIEAGQTQPVAVKVPTPAPTPRLVVAKTTATPRVSMELSNG